VNSPEARFVCIALTPAETTEGQAVARYRWIVCRLFEARWVRGPFVPWSPPRICLG
jgi:hypothetical protein